MVITAPRSGAPVEDDLRRWALGLGGEVHAGELLHAAAEPHVEVLGRLGQDGERLLDVVRFEVHEHERSHGGLLQRPLLLGHAAALLRCGDLLASAHRLLGELAGVVVLARQHREGADECSHVNTPLLGGAQSLRLTREECRAQADRSVVSYLTPRPLLVFEDVCCNLLRSRLASCFPVRTSGSRFPAASARTVDPSRAPRINVASPSASSSLATPALRREMATVRSQSENTREAASASWGASGWASTATPTTGQPA